MYLWPLESGLVSSLNFCQIAFSREITRVRTQTPEPNLLDWKPSFACILFACKDYFSLYILSFVSPQTTAHQPPLSTEFRRQEYGMGCHFLLQGYFPNQGLNSHLLCLLHCRWIFFSPTELPVKPNPWSPVNGETFLAVLRAKCAGNLWWWKKGHEPSNVGSLKRLEKARVRLSLGNSRKKYNPCFIPVKLMSDFWPIEPSDNKYAVF